MSGSSSGNNATAIPTPVAPLVDANGQITVPWRAWFQMIAQRTGGTTGFTLPTTVDGSGNIVAGVTWTSGVGDPPVITDPTKYPTAGSLYSRTDGTIAGANLLLVADGAGGWHDVVFT